MTHISLDAPKTIRIPAIRLPRLAFGKLLALFAGASEAYGSARVSTYGVAMGFGASTKTNAKREDDY